VQVGCNCESVEEGIRCCSRHHIYHLGTTPLTSVTRVIQSIIPYEPRDPAAAENARDRGVAVDELFCGYITGKLSMIPENTREDAVALFWKLYEWWNSEKRGTPEVQKIVHDDTVAGRFDLRCDGIRYDLKCTYNVSPLAAIQLAAYESLDDQMSEELMIIHVTARLEKPKIIPVEFFEAMADWLTIRSAWELKRKLETA